MRSADLSLVFNEALILILCCITYISGYHTSISSSITLASHLKKWDFHFIWNVDHCHSIVGLHDPCWFTYLFHSNKLNQRFASFSLKLILQLISFLTFEFQNTITRTLKFFVLCLTHNSMLHLSEQFHHEAGTIFCKFLLNQLSERRKTMLRQPNLSF